MLFEEDVKAANAAELTRQTLIDAQQRLGIMMDVMPMGLLIHTRQGVVYANQEAARLLGSEKNEVVGRHFLDFLDDQNLELSTQIDLAFQFPNVIETREATFSAVDGSTKTVRVIAAALPWQGTPVIQLLLQDISDLILVQEKLKYLSLIDELTGAFNRRHVFALGNQYSDPCAAEIAVILVDLDHFKSINDRYGHHAGDLTLQSLASAIKNALDEMDLPDATFARIGGEEFLVLVPQTDEQRAVQIANTLRLRIASLRIHLDDGQVISFTASFGVAMRQPRHNCFQDVVSAADEALYQAKRNGRNCIVLSQSDKVGSKLLL